MLKRLVRWGVALAVLSAAVCLLAGRLPDRWLLAYVAAVAGTSLYAIVGISEDLARERFTPPDRGADSGWLRWVRLAALGHVVVAALDIRWRFTPAVPAPIRAAALAGMTVAFLLVFRAMRENRFFSAVVRVQADRGHRVVDTGPYSVIRHPGYAGMAAGVPMSGLALGSWAALAVACVYSALILRRVAFEDQFLQTRLDGYADYTRRVRYRLFPGLW